MGNVKCVYKWSEAQLIKCRCVMQLIFCVISLPKHRGSFSVVRDAFSLYFTTISATNNAHQIRKLRHKGIHVRQNHKNKIRTNWKRKKQTRKSYIIKRKHNYITGANNSNHDKTCTPSYTTASSTHVCNSNVLRSQVFRFWCPRVIVGHNLAYFYFYKIIYNLIEQDE